MPKGKRGATLIELIVAITLLLIVATPIYGAYVLNLRSSVIAHRLTGATITAQLQIEELVGRNWDDDLVFGPSPPLASPAVGWFVPQPKNGFYVRVEPVLGVMPSPAPSPPPPGLPPADDPLLRFRVIVAETNLPNDPGLVEMEHIINVRPGGF